jgi:hypothetical protein
MGELKRGSWGVVPSTQAKKVRKMGWNPRYENKKYKTWYGRISGCI